MHQNISEFPTLDSNSVLKCKKTGDTKLVDWCSDLIRMYSLTIYLVNFWMGCHTIIKDFTPIHLLSIWDLIATYNLPMPTKGLGLNLTTSGSNIQKVNSRTPSEAEFLLFLCYTRARFPRIGSSNFRTACPSEKQYWPFQNNARKPNNGYYICKFRNMQRWFQHSTKIHMDGRIVLMGSSELLNRVIWCLMNRLEKLLDQHIWCDRMLHQIGSIAYCLQIIMWI